MKHFIIILLIPSILSCNDVERLGIPSSERNQKQLPKVDTLHDNCRNVPTDCFFEFYSINSQSLAEALFDETDRLFGEQIASDNLREQLTQWLSKEFFSAQYNESNVTLTPLIDLPGNKTCFWPSNSKLNTSIGPYQLHYKIEICPYQYIGILDTIEVRHEYRDNSNATTFNMARNKLQYYCDLLIDIRLTERSSKEEYYRLSMRDTANFYVMYSDDELLAQ